MVTKITKLLFHYLRRIYDGKTFVHKHYIEEPIQAELRVLDLKLRGP